MGDRIIVTLENGRAGTRTCQWPCAPEHKRALVALVRCGWSLEEIETEFDIPKEMVGNWAAQADWEDGRLPTRSMNPDDARELRALRRENHQLRAEREILKKAAAWFARESNVLGDRKW